MNDRISNHTCHIPYCTVKVRPELLMCKHHWMKVPRYLKKQVWAMYTEGQCYNFSLIVPGYFRASQAAIQAVLKKENAEGHPKT